MSLCLAHELNAVCVVEKIDKIWISIFEFNGCAFSSLEVVFVHLEYTLISIEFIYDFVSLNKWLYLKKVCVRVCLSLVLEEVQQKKE